MQARPARRTAGGFVAQLRFLNIKANKLNG